MDLSVLGAIGRTPITRLRRLAPPGSAEVIVKLEFLNPTGSYKDRMALAMIEEAERDGRLRPGMPVVEYTGGSTGASLALVCGQKGHPLTIVTSDAFSAEKLAAMEALGAKLVLVPSPAGVTPELIPAMRREAARIAREQGAYFTDQLNNRDILKGCERIGIELLDQLEGPIDAVCAAVGTGGMLRGIAQALKRAGQTPRVAALEPAESPVLSAGRSGTHRVEGIGIGFRPPLLDPSCYDECRTVGEGFARETARRLAREEGVLAGISSGLNVAAALELARELGPGKRVVTVAVDSGYRYMAGGLFSARPRGTCAPAR